MYIEFILTIQTFIMAIFVYVYVNEERTQKRIMKEIGFSIIKNSLQFIRNILINDIHLDREFINAFIHNTIILFTRDKQQENLYFQ